MTYRANTVVLIRFPFTDFITTKKRPALVIIDQKDQDICCVPISSKASTSGIEIKNKDCKNFVFPIDSVVRFEKIMTIDAALVEKQLGTFEALFFKAIKNNILKYLA